MSEKTFFFYRYLYLTGNNISSLPPSVFSKVCPTLRVVSVSGNALVSFPRDALDKCAHLSHLNLGYNKIKELDPLDFKLWAENLDTLILR